MSNSFRRSGTSELVLPHPFYGDQVLYHAYDWGSRVPGVRAWEFEGWREESRSWVDTCYIHAGLSRSGPFRVHGPKAADWLESHVINSFAKFPVGSMKHAVMCDDDGLIVAHGIVQRRSEDVFDSFAGGPPGAIEAVEIPGGVEVERLDHYLFQIAGPNSLEVLQRATGEDLSDIGFLRFRDTSVAGVTAEIGRVGMTGNLAYELHGPVGEGPDVYAAVVEAGHDLGIQRLGWGTYLVNHIEGGFPQQTWTFATAFDPMLNPEVAGHWRNVSGSVDPQDRRARHRTPVEVGWHNMAKFDHEFPGNEALQAEIEAPVRTTVTLRWNTDDVLGTYDNFFKDSARAPRPVELPYSPRRWPMAHADHVWIGDATVGWSSGTAFSSRYGEFLSMGCIEVEQAALGTEVEIEWGDFGDAVTRIRATVERFPYLDEGRNSSVDVRTSRV